MSESTGSGGRSESDSEGSRTKANPSLASATGTEAGINQASRSPDDSLLCSIGFDVSQFKSNRVAVACDYCIYRKVRRSLRCLPALFLASCADTLIRNPRLFNDSIRFEQIKCNAGHPCDQCEKRNRPTCTYTKERKTPRPRQTTTNRKRKNRRDSAKLIKADPWEDGLCSPAGMSDEPAAVSSSGEDVVLSYSSPSVAESSPYGSMTIMDHASSTTLRNAPESHYSIVPFGGGVDRPLNLFDEDLPESNTFNLLLRVFTETVEHLALSLPCAVPYVEASPLLRLSMSLLGTRYVSDYSAFGPPLIKRTRHILAPTLTGDVAPTIDVIQALGNLIIYAGGSSSESDCIFARRMMRQIVGFVKELGLNDETKTSVTRNWGGQSINVADRNLGRLLFWAVFCGEQHHAFLDVSEGLFRDVDLNVDLPKPLDDQQLQVATTVADGSTDPFPLAPFNTGLHSWAPLPLARNVFLHYILRRICELSLASHRNLLWTGSFTLPAEQADQRQWVRSRLLDFFLAEIEHVSQDAPSIADVWTEYQPNEGNEVNMNTGQTTSWQLPGVSHGSCVESAAVVGTCSDDVSAIAASPETHQSFHVSKLLLRRLSSSESIHSKAIIYHGFSAIAGIPRQDLEAFFNVIAVGCEPASRPERLRSKERLALWINLPLTFTIENADAGASLTPDEATVNVVTCFEHVAALVDSLKSLVDANGKIAFASPLALWCVWTCGILDLARYALSAEFPTPETDNRITCMRDAMRCIVVHHLAPFTACYLDAYERMYQWAVEFKSKLLVASLAMQPYEVEDELLESGLRFYP